LIVDENRENGEIKIEERNISLKNALSMIQVGGERNYGFGKLRVEEFGKLDDTTLFGNYKLNTGTFEIEISEDNPLISHLEISNSNNKIEKFCGEIEAFSGMEWNKKGAGQKIGNVKVCLTPGSTIKMKDEPKISLGDYGILKIQS